MTTSLRGNIGRKRNDLLRLNCAGLQKVFLVMSEEKTENRIQFVRETCMNGALFGLIAGLALSIGIWGFDAYLLSEAHAGWAWLKFLIGTPFLLLLGCFAGWLTAWFDKGLAGAIIWLLTSLVVVWVASHVPFQGLSLVIGFLKPDFAGLNVYPFVENAQARMSFLYIVVGVLMALGGCFEMFFVEAATRASERSTRLFSLLACMVIFIPVGLAVDSLINANLRDALVGVNALIEFGLKAETTPVTIQEKRAMGLSSIAPFGELIHKPYRTYLGNYDPESLSETSMYIDFGGEWGTCFAIGDRPMFCQLSRDRYVQRFACLVASDFKAGCDVHAKPENLAQSKAVIAQLAGTPQKFGVLSQGGSAILLVEETSQGQQMQCTFREAGDVLLDGCRQTANKSFAPVQLIATPSGKPAPPTPAAAEGSSTPPQPSEFAPQAALIDPSQLNIPALKGVPLYAIAVKISDGERSFQGHERLRFTNNEGVELEALYLRLFPNGQGSYGNGSLSVTNIDLGGESAEGELSVSDTVLKIPLPVKLEAGQTVELELDFSGVVPLDFGGEATPAGYGIYNYGNGVLALSGWYPLLAVYDEQGWHLDAPSVIGDSVYSDIAFYSVDVALPRDLVLAATGVQTGSQVVDGTTRYHYESGPARDFFMIASPNFQTVSQPVGQTMVNAYYLPDQEQAGRAAVEVAAGALKVYNDKFGAYPYKELNIVESPLRNALGVEYPGIVMIGDSLYKAPESPDFEVAVAHEVAHQWWYNVVGNDVFEEPWLDEALATYSSSLFYEVDRGPDYVQGLQSFWQGRYDKVVKELGDDVVTGDLKHFESLNKPSVYGAIVYSKGALFFKALRQEIGDKAFFQALQNYYRSRYFLIGHADDLLAAFKGAAGKELDGFYQKWLYSK